MHSASDYDLATSMDMCGLHSLIQGGRRLNCEVLSGLIINVCLKGLHDDAAQSLHSCVVLQLCSWGANLLYMSAQDYDLAIPMDCPLM